jgi:hypothetical protein
MMTNQWSGKVKEKKRNSVQEITFIGNEIKADV